MKYRDQKCHARAYLMSWHVSPESHKSFSVPETIFPSFFLVLDSNLAFLLRDLAVKQSTGCKGTSKTHNTYRILKL